MPYTEGTGLQAHTTHPLSLLGLKSNRETGSQQVSIVKGRPGSCVIKKPVGWGGGSDHYHS